MLPTLRPFQIKCCDEVDAKWAAGDINVGLISSVGTGKTVMIGESIRRHNCVTVSIAHRRELVGQLSMIMAKNELRHSIITNNTAYIKSIAKLHVAKFGQHFIDMRSNYAVGGVDTVVNANLDWFNKVGLLVVDEGHHVLKDNKWGKMFQKFPKAKGLLPTATPVRADGRDLGRKGDGLIDSLVLGPSMRDAIEMGYLVPYRVIGPQLGINYAKIATSEVTGDYNQKQLSKEFEAHSIAYPVAKSYYERALGKLALCFVVDIAEGKRTLEAFRSYNIPSALIDGNTPDLERDKMFRDFAQRKLWVLINVDIAGEGTDIPSVEVVIDAAPTKSLGRYIQRIGRMMRLDISDDQAARFGSLSNAERRGIIANSKKQYGLYIDLVNNLIEHGPPDAPRLWSLTYDAKSKSKNSPSSLKYCLNPKCMMPYERYKKICPYCHYQNPVTSREIEVVEGDLTEMDEALLAALRGEVMRIDGEPLIPKNATALVRNSIIKNWEERQAIQTKLRNSISYWRGIHVNKDITEADSYRLFYLMFGIDVLTAQTLGKSDALELNERIQFDILEYLS